MKILFKYGYVSDYDDMMLFIKGTTVGSYAAVYKKDEKTIEVGVVTEVYNAKEIPVDDEDIDCAEDAIGIMNPNYDIDYTAEFIRENGIFYVGIKTSIVIANEVEEEDIITDNSEYC